jgi:hypothetical protein
MGGACGWYGRQERCIESLVGTPERKRPLEDGRIILRWILKKCNGKAWTELIQLRMGRCGSL